MEIVEDDDNNLFNVFLTIESIRVEFDNEDDNNLIKKLLAIGAH